MKVYERVLQLLKKSPLLNVLFVWIRVQLICVWTLVVCPQETCGICFFNLDIMIKLRFFKKKFMTQTKTNLNILVIKKFMCHLNFEV